MDEKLYKKAENIVEKVIIKYRRKISVDGYDFEDLAQEGRIVAWEVIKEKKIDLKNFDDYIGFLYNSIKYRILNVSKKTSAKKRINLSKAISFDNPIKEREDINLYNIFPDKKIDILFKEEKLKELVNLALRTKQSCAKRAVVYFLVELLQISKKDIPNCVNYNTFVSFGLQRYLWIFFNNSPFRAINYAYPNEFLPYQMRRAPMRYWKGRRGKIRAVKALRMALHKTNYESKNYPKILNEKFFKEFCLNGALQIVFNSQIFSYLDAAFPNVYHEWDLPILPKRFFDSIDNVINAVRWLVEEKLDYNMQDLTIKDVWRLGIAYKITKETFSKHRLRTIMKHYSSPEKILRIVYPDKFLPWDFQRKDKWGKEDSLELAAKATRWVIEEYEKISPFSDKITCEFFRRNRLWGMLTSKKLGLNSSPKSALKNAYPDFDFD
ncbi:hypothetical protein ACFLZ0_02910 [Patescibacteria group bacterium]